MKRIYFIFLVTIGGFIYLFFCHFYLLAAIPLLALSSKLKDLSLKKEAEEAKPLLYRAGGERRSQERSKVDLPCVVSGLSHGQLIHENAMVISINQQGMYIEARIPLDEGSEIKAKIKAIRFGKTFWVMGKVLRSTTRGMAVRFADLLQGGSKFILHPR